MKVKKTNVTEIQGASLQSSHKMQSRLRHFVYRTHVLDCHFQSAPNGNLLLFKEEFFGFLK